MRFGRPRDRYDPVFLSDDPGKCDLRRRRVLRLRKTRDQIDQRLIGLAGLRRKARDRVAKIFAVERRAFVDLSGQKSLTERTERDETDSQFFEHREYLLFRFPPPKRILAL